MFSKSPGAPPVVLQLIFCVPRHSSVPFGEVTVSVVTAAYALETKKPLMRAAAAITTKDRRGEATAGFVKLFLRCSGQKINKVLNLATARFLHCTLWNRLTTSPSLCRTTS